MRKSVSEHHVWRNVSSASNVYEETYLQQSNVYEETYLQQSNVYEETYLQQATCTKKSIFNEQRAWRNVYCIFSKQRVWENISSQANYMKKCIFSKQRVWRNESSELIKQSQLQNGIFRKMCVHWKRVRSNKWTKRRSKMYPQWEIVSIR